MPTRPWLRSPTGWVLATVYLAIATAALIRAATCSGWACHIAGVPALVPAGLVAIAFLNLLDGIFLLPGYRPDLFLTHAGFATPMVAVNAAVLYLAGSAAERAVKRTLARRRT